MTGAIFGSPARVLAECKLGLLNKQSPQFVGAFVRATLLATELNKP